MGWSLCEIGGVESIEVAGLVVGSAAVESDVAVSVLPSVLALHIGEAGDGVRERTRAPGGVGDPFPREPPGSDAAGGGATRGAALGFDAGSVGQQLRSWLSGSTAVNLIRDDGEISEEGKAAAAAQTARLLAGVGLAPPHAYARNPCPCGGIAVSGMLLEQAPEATDGFVAHARNALKG